MDVPPTSYTHDVIYLDSSSNSPPAAQTASSSHSPSPNIHQTASSSNSPCSSILSLDVSRYSQNLSAENIMTNLKFNKKNWIIVDVKNKKSDCWKCFGIPALKNNNGNTEMFDKFVSCKYCLTTYSYSSSTRNMIKHAEACDGFNPKQVHFAKSTESDSSQVVQVSTPSGSSSANNKKLESHRQRMKSLLVEWVCSNIRPLSIVEDTGFKKLIEEAVHIGTFLV
jgi:hypothetical protein